VLVGCGRSIPPGAPGDATVTRVIDGDTIEVAIGADRHTVRLIGFDTPETHHPHRPVECHGPEAAARLAELLPPGTPVALRRDVELLDVHGRVLAYVTRRDDGLDVNLAMVAEGHGDTLRIAPNTARSADLSAAAHDARVGRRGLWAHCGGPHEPAP
jgi:micrococcal nuclease